MTSLLLFTLQSSDAQNEHIDTLKDQLINFKGPDSTYLQTLRQVALHYYKEVQTDSALLYISKMEQCARDKGYIQDEIQAHSEAHYMFLQAFLYDSAKIRAEKVIDLARLNQLVRWEADGLVQLGGIHNRRGNSDAALTYFTKALAIASGVSDVELTGKIIIALARSHLALGNYSDALANYLVIDSLATQHAKSKYLQNVHLGALINRASIHNKLGQYEKSLSVAYELLIKAQMLGNMRLSIMARREIAQSYQETGRIHKADSLYQEIIPDARKLAHPDILRKTALMYSSIKMKLGQMAAAESLLDEAESLSGSKDDALHMLQLFSLKGEYHQLQKNYPRSIQYFEKALTIKQDALNLANIHRKLIVNYENIGDFEKARLAMQRYLSLSDSISADKVAAEIQSVEAKYQASLKEKEITSLKLEKTQQDIKSQRQLFLSSFVMLILMVASFFHFYRARHRKRINQKLRDLEDFRSKLFSDISHEFRTPLSLIKGPVEVLSRQLNHQPNIQRQLGIVHRNASKLNRLVDSVQNLARLDAGKMKLYIQPANLRDHLRIIGASFDSMAASKNLDFHLDLNIPEQQFYYDPKHLETILYNLLSNAFKFTTSGDITLLAKMLGDQVQIEVKDTGIGLTEAQQEKIFERYYRVEDQQTSVEGVGIGLALAFELAKLHHGQLQVQSMHQQGSTFRLNLPINRSYYVTKGLDIGSEFVPSQTKKSSGPIPLDPNGVPIHEDEPVILLVEDNPDMRQHLESLFKDEYSIIQAKDGQEGLNKALQYIPDIIISDLMMPIMDGQDFLQAIKTDPKTSHIPFIMLTANHLEEEKIKGLEQRVDDYMTKPFSIDEIKLKVNNLIHLREQLRLKYQQSPQEEPVEQPINETEAQFWDQLQEVVQQNLDNSNFSADDFAKAMFMSRMQLHRKLKALTNLSTSIFLRTERLKAAKKMLSKPDAIIANVAYDVGFSSPSFFSKCFKEQFGMTPKEIREADLLQ